MKNFLLVILICCVTFLNAQKGNPKVAAMSYFATYKSRNKMNELILRSFPTLADAEKIFTKKEDAVQFMELIKATEKKMKEQPISEDTDYPSVDINTFTLKDIKDQKTNYNLGLLEILDKFKPNVRFYTVKLMTGNDFEPGFSYIYWMFINNKWVFIARPNLAFKK